MLLDAKSNNFMKKFSNLPVAAMKNQILSLEGDFDKYFTLYVPKGYERDAFYVFTPDVMHALISAGAAYDIEVIDNYLMLYQNKRFKLDEPEQYKTLFSVIDKISNELYTQANRYKDERAHISSGGPIAYHGRRLNKNVKVSNNVIITAACILLFILYLSVSLIFLVIY